MEQLLEKNLEENDSKTKHIQLAIKNTKKAKYIITFIVIFISVLLFISINWLFQTVGNLTVEQVVFLLEVPIQGSNMDILWEYIIQVIPISLIISLEIVFLMKVLIKKLIINKIITLVLLISSVTYLVSTTNLNLFIKNLIMDSEFIEKNYIAVNQTDIVFPKEKNNLIYIFLESMESSYTSIENGGIYEYDLIPELYEVANENINFSNTDKLGGAINFTGANWTIAGMVSQTSGLPLKINAVDNDYNNYPIFLPGAYAIGEVLEENGYKNYLMIGSDSTFGGRKSYFEQHGNYEIWDVNTAIETGRMSSDDYVWWGYDDSNLITYAKEKLLEISKNDEPFNFTMLTVDTHFPDGYVCDECEEIYESQYLNVIACSSKQIGAFIKWIQEQDFYENTTIVIAGDHISMQNSIEEDAGENYERTTYNAIINPSKNLNLENINTKNRLFTALDMYPTTLAALGAKITRERLGLGTNLFSDQKTLMEEYGKDYFIQEIEKKSNFYNSYFAFDNN